MSKFFSKAKGKNRKRGARKTQQTGTLEWLDFDEDELEDDEWDEASFEDEDYDEEDDENEEAYEEDDDSDENYEDDDDSDEVEEIEEIDEDEDSDDEYEDEEDDDSDDEYEDEEDEYDDEYDEEDDEDEDEDDEEEDDDDGGYYYEEEPRGFKKIIYFIENMSMVDHVVILTGVLVLALSVVVGTLYLGAKSDEKQIAAFAEIGVGLEGIPVIGESGLLAISDAQASKVVAEELAAIEEEATQVDDETGKIEVVMNLTSIQKDLKIKFTNKKSGKLIPNVPFTVEIKAPSGDTYSLKDEDEDGIIYQKDIASGKYKVSITGPTDMTEYSFSKEAVTITVRDTIEYKKVEVADEIKTEAQVNAAVEDTAVNDTVVESANTDTVEWVESTKTLIEGTETTSESYEKVSRSDITDPSTKSAVGFRLLTKRL
ncbi:MAG: hypothetical protein MR998_11355, partial [Lachnospiraceae bacterium]|nr:hypothetical protein [Lachnospiraceae bacterium]